jgi:hypothetical protein
MVEPRGDQGAQWIDMTMRPASEPEVDVHPGGEFEYSWTLGSGSRLTVLIPRDVADRMSSRVRELLALLPPVLPILVIGLISW